MAERCRAVMVLAATAPLGPPKGGGPNGSNNGSGGASHPPLGGTRGAVPWGNEAEQWRMIRVMVRIGEGVELS